MLKQPILLIIMILHNMVVTRCHMNPPEQVRRTISYLLPNLQIISQKIDPPY